MSVGEEIKRRRKQAGMTQEELAKKVICGRVFVAQVEGDARSPSIHVLERFADALGCRVIDFFADD